MRTETIKSSTRLSQAQVELEEQAHQEKLQQDITDQEKTIRDELYAVNMALQRIQAGSYGLCIECGRDISFERLKAVPWALTCIDCADQAEKGSAAEPAQGFETAPPASEGYQGLFDEELCSAVLERLRYDQRVPLDDLELECRGQQLIFSGTLPAMEQKEILQEIVQDTFGLHEIEDNIRIDPKPWEREERTPDQSIPERGPAEQIMEGTPQDNDPFSAVKEGESMDPEDGLAYDDPDRH